VNHSEKKAGRHSPFKNRLATAGADGTVRLWDLAFAPHGHTLATAGADDRVMLWDVSAK
jgi:WD40 repeat protein